MHSPNERKLDQGEVAALVLSMLRGTAPSELEQRYSVPVQTLEEWRRTFIDAGTRSLRVSGRRAPVPGKLNKLSQQTRRTELGDFEWYSLTTELTAEGYLAKVAQQCREGFIAL